MTDAALTDRADPLARASLHWLLRFATGVSGTYLVAEVLGWSPAYLAPLFVGVLLSSLAEPPPLKVGLALMAIMALAAAFAFVLSVLLVSTPAILFGCCTLIVFVSLNTMAHGRAVLPMTLLLLCVTLVPINAVVNPAHADILPVALARGMAVAVLATWVLFAIWPGVLPPAPQLPTADVGDPMRVALIGTAIIAPLVLAFMLYGQNHATPVVTTRLLLVAQFDVQHGAVKGFTRVFGALAGGCIAVAAYLLLAITPSLPSFALIVFLMATLIARYIARGGVTGASAQMSCNSFLVVFGGALAEPDASAGTWATRLILMAAAWLFAVGMMILFLPPPDNGRSRNTP